MGQGKSKTGGKTTSQLDEFFENECKDFGDKDFEKFDSFYHKFYMVIEKLNEKGGAMEFKLPSKEDLEASFKKHCPSGTLTKEQFKNIIKEVIKYESFSIGKGGLDVIMFLFGIPIITVLAKRIIPGGDSISEDIAIPVATAGTVFVLAKTHRL